MNDKQHVPSLKELSAYRQLDSDQQQSVIEDFEEGATIEDLSVKYVVPEFYIKRVLGRERVLNS